MHWYGDDFLRYVCPLDGFFVYSDGRLEPVTSFAAAFSTSAKQAVEVSKAMVNVAGYFMKMMLEGKLPKGGDAG